MDDCERGHKQSENESGRKRQNSDVRFYERIYKKEIKLYRGPLTTNAAEVSPINIACDGNDQDGNDELENSLSKFTDLYYLPLEILDIILKKSYLHWILNSSTKQRDEEIIRSLISVDVTFNKRITGQRLKKAIWRYLKEYYGETKKRYTIIRDNKNYLENNIQTDHQLIASLLSLNCITEEESRLIQRQRSTRDKNYELLYIVESFDETKFSTFVNCLRRTNQRTVAKIIENGGGVINIQVLNRDAKCAASMETKINDLRDKTKPRSHETDKLIVQLGEEGLEILSSQLDGQTVVVWIWCHSQEAIENLQRLYASNQLRDVYLENSQPFTSKVINIDSNQIKTTVVVRPITVNVTQRIATSENEETWGVTKLRNEIYVLFHTFNPDRNVSRIRVFQDRYPFRLQTDIKADDIKRPIDIGSSEEENCLYVIDDDENCVWKITKEADYQHKLIKWLTIDYKSYTLSVSRDGELLMINHSSHRLMIYGSDAELVRSIPLTADIKNPWHAVEKSIGNFIVSDIPTDAEDDDDEEENEDEDDDEDLDQEEDQEDEAEEGDVVTKEGKHTDWLESRQGKSGSIKRKRKMVLVVSELTRDGQVVVRRFILSNETQELFDFSYLSIDVDDRVFVANPVNDTVVLLDSDLKWNRILCPTTEEKEEQVIKGPWRLFYDQEMKQLIVAGGCLRVKNQVNVYTLSLN